ncbi:Alcohol dehydrogenase (acceptor) [Burkholderiales bacterium 8X]|nr:Alcohol dehydrogenase (acceptor) [Burkholderiales bacterium 8X]
MRPNDSYDFIVVGAGTAGCLLANRLSEDASRSVLLVEAGPRPRNFWVGMPAGVSKLIFPGKLNWGFSTEPEADLHGRRIYAPRGRGLGGSSLINGMAFFRAQPQDYDEWEAMGLEGWGWQDLQPLYRKIERREGASSPSRGIEGELSVTDARFIHPASREFVRAAEASGIPFNDDFNCTSAEGVGWIQFNIRNGVRHSSDRAFLYPVEARPNLTVLTGAQVSRLVLDGRRATGIEVVEDGRRRTISCNAEVFLSAGAFGSPHLLMNSGVGAGATLRAAGIPVLHDLPGVGRNLQDHLYIHHTFQSDPDASLNAELRGARAFWHGARYLATRQGPLTTGASQACAFVKSSEDRARPDLQICFRPVSWVFNPNGTMAIGSKPEVTASVCNLRPTSRGQILPSGADPLAPPRIQANYLSTPNDQAVAVRSVRQVRRIFEHAPLAGRIRSELAPGDAAQTDEQILDYVRRTAQSMHHWAGSCRMGLDADAVVDARLRVHGLDNVRVADASILPNIVSANTNAVTCVVAEKAAALVA